MEEAITTSGEAASIQAGKTCLLIASSRRGLLHELGLLGDLLGGRPTNVNRQVGTR